MNDRSPRNPFEDMPFSYREYKNGTISISFNDREIMTLKGKSAQKYANRLDNADDLESQMILAKVTGNFKHGNERDGKNSS
ncbi:MAG: hypothetical protein HKN25_16605 [Pyrinomonadaceae bacterium]|nr:hypothetical protein [Pyrinomonadaceae bacterium]